MVQMYRLSRKENRDAQVDKQQCNVCKQALLRKVKTNKQKYFVLHGESSSVPAKLEYYNSKKHWDNRLKPRKIIYLRSCFSINPFSDTRILFGINIFTEDESLQISFESEAERDAWHMAMKSLCNVTPPSVILRSSPTAGHSWEVEAISYKMETEVRGDFTLRLTEQHIKLMKSDEPLSEIVLPYDVIKEYGQKNNHFVLDVGQLAETGSGEIWIKLEDALIARNVNDVFTHNMNALTSKTQSPMDGFRPPSKSLSYKDKKSAMSRHYNNNLHKSSGRVHSAIHGQVSPFVMATTSITRLNRTRADSLTSQSTTASISTEDIARSHHQHDSSRCTTPDLRSEDAAYMDMSHGGSPFTINNSSSSLNTSGEGYVVMSPLKSDGNPNLTYVDMSVNTSINDQTYVEMAQPGSQGLKPQRVSSFVTSNDSLDNSERRHNSVGANPLKHNARSNMDYVDMKSQNHPSLPQFPPEYFCKSCSKRSMNAENTDLFAALDHDQRHRTKSFTSSHRPRQSSFSKFTRPRASSHGQKQKCRFSLPKAVVPPRIEHLDYIDMNRNASQSQYVEMHPSRKPENQQRTTHPSKGELEISEPFPQLSGSDDNVSLRSVGSSSAKSHTSSLDNMSQASSTYNSSDSEAYVMMNPQSQQLRRYAQKAMPKPKQVMCYIVDEQREKPACQCNPSK